MLRYPLVDAVKYCVELGNDVNAADNRGYTALHGAAYLGNNDMINFLVSKGAKVDAKSKAGDSPGGYGEWPHPIRPAASGERGAARKARVAQFAQLPLGSMRGGGPGEYLRSSAERGGAGRQGLLDKFADALGFKEATYLSMCRARGLRRTISIMFPMRLLLVLVALVMLGAQEKQDKQAKAPMPPPTNLKVL